VDTRVGTAPLRQGGRVTLQAPIDRYTHGVLRAAVLELVEGESRRRFPTAVHAGIPGRSVRHVEDPPVPDAGLRADVVLSLLLRGSSVVRPPLLWLTRSGELSPPDDDLRWLGPARWAASSLGLPVGLVVVTRRGWFDPVTDVRREWRRLRRRSAA